MRGSGTLSEGAAAHRAGQGRVLRGLDSGSLGVGDEEALGSKGLEISNYGHHNNHKGW